MSKTPEMVIKIANNEIGYLEKASNAQLDDKTANAGSANYTKYWRDLAPSMQGQAWCNCFLNWIFTQAYGDSAKAMLCTNGAWSYYTPTSAQYFKNAGRWYTTPKAGDVIYFKNSTRIHHVGLVYKVSGGVVYTIEGNTGSGNNTVIPNGGGVFAKSYNLSNSNIAGYGRPKYDEDIKVVDIPVSTDRKGVEIVGTSSLNVRTTPVDGTVVDCYKCGELVQVTAKAKAADGTYWFKTSKGYISGKYIKGWLKEANNRWWYIEQGYKYPTSVVKKIESKYYVFDTEGWLVTPSYMNADGSLK